MRLCSFITLIGLVLCSVGCGKSDNNAVYPVRGKVTFNGKPMMGGGSIALVPKTNMEGATPGGSIKEDGTYELSTYGEGDGSMPGEFKVLIYQTTSKEPEAVPDGQAAPKVEASVPKADQIPLLYSDPARTKLTAKVEAKDLNEINFDLKK